MNNRTQLSAVLRDAVAGNDWLALYALFRLVQEVDLDTLQHVVDAVLLQEEEQTQVGRPTALRRLVEERWQG